jgi:hypothetical protein
MILSLRMQFEEETQEENEIYPEKAPVAIYSQWAILGFSIFASPLFGSILMMLNLRWTGRKATGYMMLIFGFAYNLIATIALGFLIPKPKGSANMQQMLSNPKAIAYTMAFYVLGGAILTEVFFKKYFPEKDYRRRSIIAPLLVLILLSFLLSGLL